MPSQIQYYNSSPSVSGILNPQTSQNAVGPIRARDPFPTNTVPRIRPATGFQFRDVSPPRGKPVWNDARTKTDTCTGSLRRFRAKRPKSAPLDRFQGSQASITRSGSVTGGKVLYKVTVKTGDKKNAGTDAKVYLRMKGLKGKFNKKRLFKSSGSDKYAETSTFQFSRGSCHTFKVYGPEIGDIKNIILEVAE
ncbi:Lipoxygenase homology domain-containing protein 1 [Acipenser ruthenus]|uniref:Lipoxygenase homology domain-containing protein 1 n=1 Tax=Acipenser ruthenus TaxID=7906 RepID=A0A444TX78_ACIRT|nr:Lipoxygenase homology domain-containing protein 1 [Acipenser ruthenus]